METTKESSSESHNVASNGEPASGVKGKQTFGTKVKRHCTRFWWIWLIVFIILVLIIVLPM